MAENGGLVCGTYPICIHLEVTPRGHDLTLQKLLNLYLFDISRTIYENKSFNHRHHYPKDLTWSDEREDLVDTVQIKMWGMNDPRLAKTNIEMQEV